MVLCVVAIFFRIFEIMSYFQKIFADAVSNSTSKVLQEGEIKPSHHALGQI